MCVYMYIYIYIYTHIIANLACFVMDDFLQLPANGIQNLIICSELATKAYWTAVIHTTVRSLTS